MWLWVKPLTPQNHGHPLPKVCESKGARCILGRTTCLSNYDSETKRADPETKTADSETKTADSETKLDCSETKPDDGWNGGWGGGRNYCQDNSVPCGCKGLFTFSQVRSSGGRQEECGVGGWGGNHGQDNNVPCGYKWILHSFIYELTWANSIWLNRVAGRSSVGWWGVGGIMAKIITFHVDAKGLYVYSSKN